MTDAMETTFTSASRLLDEAHRARKILAPNELPMFHFLDPWLGDGPQTHWSYGLIALRRVLDQADSDLEVLSERRRPKYGEAIQLFRTATEPAAFHRAANDVARNILNDALFDRLDSLDEHLLQANRQRHVDSENADYIKSELAALLAEIDGWPESPLKTILISRLAEISFVVDRYSLFGPEGAKDAVERLIGSLSLFGATNPIGKDSEKTIKRAFALAKGVVDVLVYGHAGAQALTWSGDGVAALLKSI